MAAAVIKLQRAIKAESTYSVVRDRLPITNGDPSRVPIPPPAVPGFPLFPRRKLCAVRRVSQPANDRISFSHRDTVQDYFLCTSEVRFPADGSGRLQRAPFVARKGRGVEEGRGRLLCHGFVVLSARVIPHSHSSSTSSSFSLHCYVCTSICHSFFQGINRRWMLDWKLKIDFEGL